MAKPYQSLPASVGVMRSRYAATLQDLEKQATVIRAKIQVLDEILDAHGEAPDGQRLISQVASADAIPSGLTDAVLWVLNKYDQVSPLSPAEIRTHLATNGHKTAGKNLSGILAITLKRLREGERVEATKSPEGMWRYSKAA